MSYLKKSFHKGLNFQTQDVITINAQYLLNI